MNSGFFKPSDIKIQNCIFCNYEIEFWKDDIKLKCRSCGKTNFNASLGDTCLVWCKSAERCLGNDDIKEWIKNNKK
jgi:hypothetical protein